MIDNNDLNDVFGEDAWYEPGEDSSGGSVESGNHDEVVVDDLNIKRDIKVQGKYLADIYEPVFNINGKKIKHKGVLDLKNQTHLNTQTCRKTLEVMQGTMHY